MTVYDNMAFGLRNSGVVASEINRRITEAARMLELDALLKRRPAQLSGGQRQRVAIGRAVVKEPEAFLFDEPLSNLDAALRTRTRVELARIHRRLSSTMVFVTHDQIEAMTLATRIVVMNRGRIEQIGAPLDIYRRPLDYGASNQAFMNGKAGVLICGTWVIEDLTNLSKKTDSPLANNGHEVVPFPNLFQKKAVWADGRSWVMLKGGAKDDKSRHAAFVFLKFLYDHDADWARTGHLPARQSVIDSAAFNALPHRAEIKEISSTGYSLPNTVPRQFAIQEIGGSEVT
jgi:energy-coupling factor transporter ATP-binding protein EcfA2